MKVSHYPIIAIEEWIKKYKSDLVKWTLTDLYQKKGTEVFWSNKRCLNWSKF